jgi:hypothetical protein
MPTNKTDHLAAVVAALESLPPELKRELADRLNVVATEKISAQAANHTKKLRTAMIAAARSERHPDFLLSEGILRRANISIDEATSVAELDKMLASATRPVSHQDRLTVKSALFRLGIIG